MEITRTAAAEHVELKLKGRLDAIWSDHMGRALAECVRAGQHALVLEMSEVDYISSAGIRILVTYAKQLKSLHGRLAVINPSENVRIVLKLAGLSAFLQVGVGPVAASLPAGEQASGGFGLSKPGPTAEVYDLDPNATLQVDWPGDPAAWLVGHAPPASYTSVEFPLQTLGLGLGVLGAGEASAGDRLGEFLAAGGAAICQIADGTRKPDYLLLQGSLTPTVQVAYGLVARGGFRHLLRFDKGAKQASVPLSAVVQACFDAAGSEAVALVMVAETAALIGAALQKTPGPPAVDSTRSIFAFPDVRDWLSFTPEPALPNTTSLIVGLAAKAEHATGLRLLKPLVRSGELHGHFHAAAFPYRPLRKGLVELAATVGSLFESEQVLGLLHLLNDWRPASGAGESRFLRGACWCAPIEPSRADQPEEDAALKETIEWE
jgi:anti-anti-sigma factor